MKPITHWTTLLGQMTSHPAAFLVVLVYAGLWWYYSPQTFEWFAIASLAIWCMTLFIQRANRRDTLALHAKLDELLKVTREARTELTKIDESEPEDIEKVRDEERTSALTKPHLRPVK